MKRVLTLLFVLSTVAVNARAADQVIFLVRHAEKGTAPAPAQPSHTMMADDPPLSAEGRARAAKLAATLASAGVTRIFTTEYKRTRETAAPLAAALKLQPVLSAAKDPEPLLQQLQKLSGTALIVGHSNSVPDLLKRLGVKEPVAIADNEYDNLFVVVRRAGAEPTLIRLRY